MSTATIPTLDVTERSRIGTRYAKRDRAAGLIPAVIYGHKQEPMHVTLHGKTFTDLLHHEVHIIDVKLNGSSEHTLIKSVQWDTFGREVIHVDLERVDLSETIEVEVELVLTGEPKALKQAGTVLDHPTTMVTISCRADSIPSHLEHDITDLPLGEPLTVADLTPPAGITIVMPAEQLICQIAGVREEKEEAAPADTAAQPEVISKGKEEEKD